MRTFWRVSLCVAAMWATFFFVENVKGLPVWTTPPLAITLLLANSALWVWAATKFVREELV